MSDSTRSHLLHLDGVSDGYPHWRLECLHDLELDNRWNQSDCYHPGCCWLMSSWETLGQELVNIHGPIVALPIAVRPCLDWCEDDQSIVLDREVPNVTADPTAPHPARLNLCDLDVLLVDRVACRRQYKALRIVIYANQEYTGPDRPSYQGHYGKSREEARQFLSDFYRELSWLSYLGSK